LLAPPSPESEYAREGTALHEIAARCLTENRAPLDADLWGALERTPERVEVVSAYVAHVRMLVALDDAAPLIEHRVYFGFSTPASLTTSTGEFDCYGTADALVWTRTRLIVADLKTGAGVDVDAQDNDQLAIYALAALDSNPGLAQDITDVELHIVQPRTSREPKVWAISRVDLEDRRQTYKRAIVAGRAVLARQEARPEHYGPGEWCRFCGKVATCEARQSYALVAAQGMFDALDAPRPSVPLPVDMTADQIRAVLDRADVLVDWLKLVRDEASNRLARGASVPGYKLVTRQGNRQWRDEQAARLALETLGVDPVETTMRSPASIEREIGKGAPILAALTHRPELSPVLAPESDKRPAAPPLQFPREVGGVL